MGQTVEVGLYKALNGAKQIEARSQATTTAR